VHSVDRILHNKNTEFIKWNHLTQLSVSIICPAYTGGSIESEGKTEKLMCYKSI